MNIFEAFVFIAHYLFFAVAVVLFLLKFLDKPKGKYLLYFFAVLWIIFGITDFILGFLRLISSLG